MNKIMWTAKSLKKRKLWSNTFTKELQQSQETSPQVLDAILEHS